MNLPDALDRVIVEAYINGIYVNSDYYRAHAQEVAAAASLGFLTTETPEGFGRVYRPTASGMVWVQNGGDV